MTPERCTVLADEAIAPDTLDRGAIEADLQVVEGNLPSLREQVARATGTDRERLLIELHRLERDQAVLQAKLQALAEPRAEIFPSSQDTTVSPRRPPPRRQEIGSRGRC